MLGWKSRYNKAQIFNFIPANKYKTISRLSSDGLKNQPKGFIGRGTGGDAAPIHPILQRSTIRAFRRVGNVLVKLPKQVKVV